MDAQNPVGSIAICRQCFHYADLLGRNVADFWLLDPRALDALVKEIEMGDTACACSILRGWGVWYGEPETSLSHSDVWLRELPPRSVKARFEGKDGERRFQVLQAVRPDLQDLGKRWHLCWCSGNAVCSVCSRLRHEEDDADAGPEIEW